MSTTTTNYGFTKMDPGEPASVSIWNANLDAIDTEIATTRAVANPNRWACAAGLLSNNIPFLSSSATYTELTGFEPLFDDNDFELFAGFGTAPIDGGSLGHFSFSLPGIYLIHYTLSIFGQSTAITEGVVGTAILRDSDNVAMKEHRVFMEVFNGDMVFNSTWLVKVGTGGDLATGTLYRMACFQQNSSGSSVTIGSAHTRYIVELVKE